MSGPHTEPRYPISRVSPRIVKSRQQSFGEISGMLAFDSNTRDRGGRGKANNTGFLPRDIAAVISPTSGHRDR